MTFKGELYPFQQQAVDMMLDRKSLLLAHDLGLGKALADGTPVLTARGWVPVQDVVVGDHVFSELGGEVEVLGVFAQGKRQLYRVTFSDGAWVDCDFSHLWQVTTNNQRLRRNAPSVLTTGELIAGGLRYGGVSQMYKYQIPVVQPVRLKKSKVPLDPYLMGLLLGDGGLSRRNRVGFTTADIELVDAVKLLLPEGNILKHTEGYDYLIQGVKWHTNPLLNIVRELGLSGHRSERKFIPECYRYGSLVQRTRLLQGLLDTDGHVRPKDNNVEYSTSSFVLAEQVRELVQSLGGVTTVRERPTTHLISYRMSIILPQDILPFKLKRKAGVYRPRSKYGPVRTIRTIEDVGIAEATCLKVDNPSGLFVTKDFIVTHNTVTTIAALEQLIDEGTIESALVVCPASVKWQWKRAIDRFSDGALVKVIEGNKNERRAQYRGVMRGDVEYVIMNYEQVVSDWDMVRHLPFDAAAFDEIVAIKNPGAKRSRHLKRLKMPYRFGLSGLPIENKPEELYSIMEWVDSKVLGEPHIFERTFIRRNNYGRVQNYRNLKLLRRTMKTCMHRKKRSDPDVRDQMPDVVREDYIIEFDARTKKLYTTIARELIDIINSTPKWTNFDVLNHYSGVNLDGTAAGQIMPLLMALRMLCDHPQLLTYSADNFDDPDTKLGSQYASQLRRSKVLDKLKRSPKLDATLEVMQEILDADPDNKIVLFSFFKPMLQIISDNLKVGHELYTGDLTPRERDAAVERFTANRSCRVLLSSDAGGIGVDLPIANYLISFDLPWSAGKFVQREGRIIRISSEWPEVTLLSMVMKDSIEERMAQILAEKSAVAAAWIDGKGVDSRGEFVLSVGTLVDFLEESLIAA